MFWTTFGSTYWTRTWTYWRIVAAVAVITFQNSRAIAARIGRDSNDRTILLLYLPGLDRLRGGEVPRMRAGMRRVRGLASDVQRESRARSNHSTTCGISVRKTYRLRGSMRSKMRIAGPTANGFFIHDTDNRVWDGKSWRGFGCPEYYAIWPEAFEVLQRLNGRASLEQESESEQARR